MRTPRSLLFGGALWAAGTAQAQHFDFPPSRPHDRLVNQAYVAIESAHHGDIVASEADPNITGEPAYAALGYEGRGGWASIGHDGISAYAYATSETSPALTAIAQSWAYFSVSAESSLVLTWDLSQTPPDTEPGSALWIRVEDVANGYAYIFEEQFAFEPGTAVIPLRPDSFYVLFLTTFATGPEAWAFGDASISPGACWSDCTFDGTVSETDLACYADAFFGRDPYIGDCDQNGLFNMDDVDCFVAGFLAGCP